MIETSRLVIRPFQKEDAQSFYTLTLNEGFNAYPITVYRQKDIASAEVWINKNTSKYAVIEKSSGVLIGMGGLTPWTYNEEKLIDITYRLHSNWSGKGLGTELAKALTDYAFRILHLNEITATITPDNLPSIKLAAALGMKFDQRIELQGVQTDLYRLKA